MKANIPAPIIFRIWLSKIKYIEMAKIRASKHHRRPEIDSLL